MASVVGAALLNFLGPAVATTVGTAVANIAGGLLLSTLGRVLAGTPDAPSVKAKIEMPTSLPGKRFVFGIDQKADGTQAPGWVTKKGWLYACYIMNSAPSDSVSQIVIDGRYGDLLGDPYDFTGPGANADIKKIKNFTNIWIGRGAQTAPPDLIMTQNGDATSVDPTLFWPTDAGQGLTVIWARYKKGGDDDFMERWSAVPPKLSAIGNWTKVWDPRDPLQDADNPATWTVSNNAWLCILHTLRFNPMARWPLAQLQIDSFIEAANNADATRPRLDTTTEPLWRMGGTAYFGRGGTLYDIIMPMLAATGGDILISGEGLTAIPAGTRTPVFTVTDWIAGSPVMYRARQEGREQYSAVQASWPQPEANFELQTLEPTVVPGRTWNGGDDDLQGMDVSFVPFAAQAMHLQAITARRQALEREITFTLGPDLYASGAQAGDWITVDLPDDYTGWGGTYEIISLGEFDLDLMTQTVTAREVDASVYAFDAATDEQEVYDATFIESDPTLEPLIAVALTQTALGTGPTISVEITPAESHILRRATFDVELLDTAGVVISTQRVVLPTGDLPLTTKAKTVIHGADPDTTYDVRVTAVSGGLRSDPLTETIAVGAYDGPSGTYWQGGA